MNHKQLLALFLCFVIILSSKIVIGQKQDIVEVKNVPTIGQLTISCKGKDIEIDAARVINDDIRSILLDLQINTYLKEEIADIIFSSLTVTKKRIEIRKLRKKVKLLERP